MAITTEHSSNKRSAVRFLEMVTSGNIDQAYQEYADMAGRHHNAFFASGFPSLMKAMKENDVHFPDKSMSVKNVLGDGDLVAVHSLVVLKPGDPEMIAVHLFRFQNGKIVEMWDCGQAIPASSPNKDGMF